MAMRVRSMVGLIPLFACLVLEDEVIQELPGFKKRLTWFLNNRPDLAKQVNHLHLLPCTVQCLKVVFHLQVAYLDTLDTDEFCHLLAIPTKERLTRVLKYLLDEDEFLSPYGIRSLSKIHEKHPFVMQVGSEQYCVSYVPGESNTHIFGGNSNWRGPIWLCGEYPS